ncbi:MAG: lipopolysaccharide biosynthesis protein [Ruminococcus sp.]|nr:lipopolysaccharide biosynthesis protein [Ruminococcus sp.]
MTIQDLFAILLAKIKFIIIMAIIGGVAAFCVAEFWMPIKYSTSVKIYVKSSTNTSTGNTTTADLTTARTLAETYIIILDDTSIYEKVADKFMEEYEAEELQRVNIPLESDSEGNLRVSPSYIRGCVSISSVNESEVLQISATTQIPQIATDICNYMVEVAPDVLRRVTKAGSVEEISAPKVPLAPSSPNVKKITVMGILVGIIGSVALIVLISYFNNKIVSSSEVREKFGVPVLAEIPNFDTKTKKGVYK